ncbi:MAG TPA: hypothetical protein VN579_04435 [Bryobacteraceae bacterium]|nr:hypothetical protein [Bryobacteraceae bacterium]
MTRSATWLLTKAGVRVCCELTDDEFQALPHVTLTGLLAAGVKVTRTVKVSAAEFVEIGGLGVALLEKGLSK